MRKGNNTMNSPSFKFGSIIFIIGITLIPFGKAWAHEWVFYAASTAGADPGPKLRDWYILNRIEPVPSEDAGASHYFDRESIGGNIGFPGGIFRVWEKYVVQSETKSYEETKAEVENEEERRLGRKPNSIDYGLLFPLIVNRATKEIHTLYELNCDSREFIILEVNYYDNDGIRMTRDINMDMDLWYPIEQGTVMEALFLQICTEGVISNIPKASGIRSLLFAE
jgi:hypothetical protein